MAPREGEWLCPPGPYQELIKSLIPADPRLRQRDSKTDRHGTHGGNATQRIVHLTLQGSAKSFQQTGEWSDLTAFRKDYLDSSTASTGTNPSQNILLVEGISPDLVDALGTHFNIHPSFFVDHETISVFSVHPQEMVDPFTLPSIANWKAGAKGVTLKYFEPLGIDPCLPSFSTWCAHTDRHVAVFRVRGKIHPVVVVRRKCSIWPVIHPGGGYTCVILCDPPLTKICINYKYGALAGRPVMLPVSTIPFQGGYLDFMMNQGAPFSGTTTAHGPSRLSMLDDLRFYLTAYGQKLPDLNDVRCPSVFITKIVAGHYNSLMSFMSSVLSAQQHDLSRQDDMARFSIGTVEQRWSDIQSWESRLNEYLDNIEDVMAKLSIPFHDGPDSTLLQPSTWHKPDADFQYLSTKFQSLRNRVEQINAAMSGLAGIAGNRQSHKEQQISLRETQRTKSLTLIGLVFLPMAYTATLFSMNDRYMPGAKQFWVYFSVSIPLVVAVVGAYFALDMLYGDTQVLDVRNVIGKRGKKLDKAALGGGHRRRFGSV